MFCNFAVRIRHRPRGRPMADSPGNIIRTSILNQTYITIL